MLATLCKKPRKTRKAQKWKLTIQAWSVFCPPADARFTRIVNFGSEIGCFRKHDAFVCLDAIGPIFMKTRVNDQTKMVRTGAVAKALGVSGRAVNEWCHAGSLAAFVLPGQKHWRIKIRDAAAFAKKHGLPFDARKL